jgi:hypothetical protein
LSGLIAIDVGYEKSDTVVVTLLDAVSITDTEWASLFVTYTRALSGETTTPYG